VHAVARELVANLSAEYQARVATVPIVIDPNPNDVNAFAACSDSGVPWNVWHQRVKVGESCPVPPPDDWVMSDYGGDRARIVTFLEQYADECVHIPYRENRAVLFRSRLFHHSDAPEFATDYEDHRINITLLFGRN